ncbi:MAG: hypothetical protein OEV92_13055 [Nitrospinota bacterium]|nr:hypothetical protein [Nitrospinota bacterium]
MEGGAAKKLTEAQRQQIAEIRQVGEAKKAEVKIMMDDKLRKLAETAAAPEVVTKTRREFQDQIDKIERDTDAKAEKVKRG